MNKYSDAEIETAKNLLKKGFKWIARDSELFDSDVYAYAEKPRKELYSELHSNKANIDVWIWRQPSDDSDCTYVCSGFVPIFENIKNSDSEPTSLANIVHPSPLDEVEKRYLSAVIRPFKFYVWHIRKVNSEKKYGYQKIVIGMFDDSEPIVLPLFKKDTMYKGMEVDHFYKLDELGIE